MLVKIINSHGETNGIRIVNDGYYTQIEGVYTLDLTEKKVFNAYMKAKNDIMYAEVKHHDTTENFYKLLKRYAGKKSYLTVSEFAALVSKIGYDGYYYSYGVISAFEEVKVCKKSLKVIDSTNTVTYIRYDGKTKFYIDNFMLVHNDSNNKNNVYHYCR